MILRAATGSRATADGWNHRKAVWAKRFCWFRASAIHNDVRGHIPGDDDTLLRTVRGICIMLTGGTATWYIVPDIAQHFGISNMAADQVMDAAMGTACPGLVVGPDSVARPAR